MAKKKLHINSDTRNNLISYKSNLPRAYAVPKIHKPNIPYRLIVSSIYEPTYNLSKWLPSLLNCCKNKYKYNIKNSFEFSKFIQSNRIIPKNFEICSLDVVLLFKNVSIELVINIIISYWTEIKNSIPLPQNEFITGLKSCLNNTYFSFNNKIYKQIFAASMGSPLSPIIADILMDRLIFISLKNIKFEVYFIKKYVDDLLLFTKGFYWYTCENI